MVTIIFFCFKKMNLAEQKLTHFGKARIRHLGFGTIGTPLDEFATSLALLW